MVTVRRREGRRFTGQNHSGTTGEGARLGRAPLFAPGGKGCGTAWAFLAQGLFQKMNGIADTGLLVAFGNRNDHYHDWAVHIARGLRIRCRRAKRF